MFSFTTIVAFSLTLMCQTGAGQPSPKESPQLADAIKAFNEKAATDPIGKDQPPITEEEVMAAIRHSQRPEVDPPVTAELFAAFKQIATTHALPPNAEFEKLTGYDPGGAYVFDVWSVRIRMSRPDGSSYAFGIREQMIRSRTLEAELVIAERKLRDIQPAAGEPSLPGIGPRGLEERVKALKDRIAKQKAK
jgi:hypothetical protein